MKYSRRRDAAEKAIILALRAAGCGVQQLDGKGVPDLLVGYADVDGEMRPRLVLLEVKDPDDGERNSRAGSGKKVTNPLGLRDSQWDWYCNWTGPKPIVVTTPREALDAVFHAYPVFTHGGRK